MPIRILVFTLATALLTPLAAQAQIYAWRDANGTLVLSDRKLNTGARTLTYVVPDAPGIRATKPLVASTYRDQFEPMVRESAARHAVRPELVRAVIQVESGFNPRARSPKGAMGLMQLMPATAREMGVQDAYNPADNIRGGTAYLRKLIDRYQGNEELALAAYNAGSDAVDRYGKTVPPYRETRDYVKRVGERSGDVLHASLNTRMVYKTLEIVDGRAIPRYTSAKPAAGTFQVVVQ
jgi:soluble lytic murein transglycosylase-like protein